MPLYNCDVSGKEILIGHIKRYCHQRHGHIGVRFPQLPYLTRFPSLRFSPSES